MKFILNWFLDIGHWPRRVTAYKTSDGHFWFDHGAALNHQARLDRAADSCVDDLHCYRWPGDKYSK